jgi:hypothetical protein
VQDKLCFVQFMHPGGEHQTSGDTIPWNTEGHKRKGLVQRGRASHDGKISEGEIVFWGEWEPESLVVDPWAMCAG